MAMEVRHRARRRIPSKMESHHLSSSSRLFSLSLFAVVVSFASANQPPVFTKEMENQVVSESKAIGSVIFTLQGTDPEGSDVKYGLLGTDKLTVNPRTGEVTLVRPLDRETSDKVRFTITLEDEVPGEPENNLVQMEETLIVMDENDNPPKFIGTPYEASVLETSQPGLSILRIQLTDEDLVGEALKIVCEAEPQSICDTFEFQTVQDFSPEDPDLQHNQNVAVDLLLNQQLNYGQRSLYQFTLIGTDGKFTSTASGVIRVEDVQDSPPVFLGSLSTLVPESTPPGSLILTLQASDGDRGKPRALRYQLLDSIGNMFSLDPETGELRTAKPLDREAMDSKQGIIRVPVKAVELDPVTGEPVGGSDAEATAMVTLTIEDENDEAPRFSAEEYHASIPENAPAGTPLSGLDMRVTDTDVGSNSRFVLSLKDPSGLFSIEPQEGQGSSSVSIRLNSDRLDYENPNQRKFILVVEAREVGTKERLSSSAAVTVSIQDINDNSPVFERSLYAVRLSETSPSGTEIAQIVATDRDSDPFGTKSLKYTIFGEGAERFQVDEKSGRIYVSPCSNPGQHPCLDYERKQVYFLSFKATDTEGEGRSSQVPIRISLSDSNDNPPLFDRPKYTAAIMEGSTEFKPPLKIVASDADTTSKVFYTLVSSTVPEAFDVGYHTGQIIVKDRQNGIRLQGEGSVRLEIEATDGLHSTRVPLEVVVQDTNDNHPTFQEDNFVIEVPEHAQIGSVVAQVTATDSDSGRNALIIYQIQSGSFGDFDISAKTGKIKVAKKLEYDRVQKYELLVVARDGGIPSLSGTTVVTINILNTNDKFPTLNPSTQRASVAENAPPGSLVTLVNASDSDATSPLKFYIERNVTALDSQGRKMETTEQTRSLFSINSETGEIFVNSELTRDFASIVTLPILVVDPSADPPQETHGSVVITVLDINDHPPEFAMPQMTLRVREELPMGAIVWKFKATDPEGPISRYELLQGEDTKFFKLDKDTGQLTMASRLDYESVENFNFSVFAFDSGIPQLFSSALVTVHVLNENDETPQFTKDTYRASIPENSQKGTIVASVKAEDKDKGEFGKVTYSLEGPWAPDFTIDESGDIRVENPEVLDREVNPELRLLVSATDGEKRTQVPVVVTLLDENDNSPKFAQTELEATVADDLPVLPPSPILQVAAVDPDSGVNAEMAYQIVSGNDEEYFRLDTVTGVLYPARSLLHPSSPSEFKLKIRVRDLGGDGPFTDEATVHLKVQKTNRHRPIFVEPSASGAAVVEIPENSTEPEQLVTRIRAEDPDDGLNGRVMYHLRVGDQDVQETEVFRLDPVTGELMTVQFLDREKMDHYALVVVARDQGEPMFQESLMPLTIEVQDINDNMPIFEDAERIISFSVLENLPAETRVGKVEATDADVGINARIFYHILRGNDDGHFTLDKYKGILYTRQPLDREAIASYELVIKASNKQDLIPMSSDTEGDPSDPSVAIVTVKVVDENDNEPEFERKKYFTAAPLDAEVGYTLLTVTAHDPDLNATLSYYISSSLVHRLGSNESMGSLLPSPFSISSEGEIQTQVLLGEFRRDWFLLEVLARETVAPFREIMTQVEVWFYDPSWLLRVILSAPPRDVVSIQHLLTDKLTLFSDQRVIAADLRQFVDDENQIQRDWTELHVIGVDPLKRSLTSPSVILKAVDANHEQLKEYYDSFQVEHILPYESPLEEASSDPLVAVLVALLIIMAVGSLSVCIICCCLKQCIPTARKERLINRETPPHTPGSVPVPTNGVATENPLWIDSKARIYEEQELSMQVSTDRARRANSGPTMDDSVTHQYATIGRDDRHSRRAESDYATVDHGHVPGDHTSDGRPESRRNQGRPPGPTLSGGIVTPSDEDARSRGLSTFRTPDGSPQDTPKGRRSGGTSPGKRKGSKAGSPRLTVAPTGEPQLVTEVV